MAGNVKHFAVASFLLILTCGCHTYPEKADRFAAPRPSFPKRLGKAALLYIPNRLMDLIDVFHVGWGIGPGFGLEVQATRPVSLGAVFGTDASAAWLGRNTQAFQAVSYARANFSEWSNIKHDAGSQEAAAGRSRESPATRCRGGCDMVAVCDIGLVVTLTVDSAGVSVGLPFGQ